MPDKKLGSLLDEIIRRDNRTGKNPVNSIVFFKSGWSHAPSVVVKASRSTRGTSGEGVERYWKVPFNSATA